MGGAIKVIIDRQQKPGISGEFANRVTDEVVVPK
jgi:hypothetical protein